MKKHLIILILFSFHLKPAGLTREAQERIRQIRQPVIQIFDDNIATESEWQAARRFSEEAQPNIGEQVILHIPRINYYIGKITRIDRYPNASNTYYVTLRGTQQTFASPLECIRPYPPQQE